jgi:hypothetical protein
VIVSSGDQHLDDLDAVPCCDVNAHEGSSTAGVMQRLIIYTSTRPYRQSDPDEPNRLPQHTADPDASATPPASFTLAQRKTPASGLGRAAGGFGLCRVPFRRRSLAQRCRVWRGRRSEGDGRLRLMSSPRDGNKTITHPLMRSRVYKLLHYSVLTAFAVQ